MSTTSQFFSGGGVKSVQTGFVNNGSLTNGGAGQDNVYCDVTISSVNTAKSVVFFDGGGGSSLGSTAFKGGATASFQVMPRLTSATNLRLSVPTSTPTTIAGQWTVLEFN